MAKNFMKNWKLHRYIWKSINITIIILSLQTNISAQTVEWVQDMTHDFGEMPQYEPDSIEFKFINTSEYPISIDNVRSTCGCTAPRWSKGNIAPTEQGSIWVSYDAARPNWFRKKVMVFFNTQRKAEKLYVTGIVLRNEQ